MTNKFALFFGIALIGVIILDITQTEGAWLFFLAARLHNLIEWLAFWR
jgi:hypothetical protein